MATTYSGPTVQIIEAQIAAKYRQLALRPELFSRATRAEELRAIAALHTKAAQYWEAMEGYEILARIERGQAAEVLATIQLEAKYADKQNAARRATA